MVRTSLVLAVLSAFAVTAWPLAAQQSSSATVVEQQQRLSQAELDQLLAPIALYPDTVLSHVLIASTYPLEIVKATRWLSAQGSMTSEQALKAAENEAWDPSVRALVAFPPLLTRMNNELEWTQQLGDAFLIQPDDVMNSVQRLRDKAYAAGNLQQQPELVVERRDKVIVIEPRQTDVVYVPVYDTRYVYGDWYWREYPPIYWNYPSAHYSSSYFYWGFSARIAPGFYFSTFSWPRREVIVVHDYHKHRPHYRSHDIIVHENRRHWQHNPQHRHGISYPKGYRSREDLHDARPVYDRNQQRHWSAEQRIERNLATPRDRELGERGEHRQQVREYQNSREQLHRIQERNNPALLRHTNEPGPVQRDQKSWRDTSPSMSNDPVRTKPTEFDRVMDSTPAPVERINGQRERLREAKQESRRTTNIHEPGLEPIRVEPRRVEPTRVEPNRVKPQFESHPVEPRRELRSEPTRIEASREIRSEPTRVEPRREIRSEPMRVEPRREIRSEPMRVEPRREIRSEPMRVEPRREIRSEPTRVEPRREMHQASNRQEARAESGNRVHENRGRRDEP